MQLNKNAPEEDHSFFPDHLLNPDPSPPTHPPNTDSPTAHTNQFYLEYRKIYTVSHHLHLETRRHIALMETLNRRIRQLEEKMRDTKEREPKRETGEDEARGKRARRTAEEIEKRYKCVVDYCERVYGAEGSLQQHIKLKHPELYVGRQSNSEARLSQHSF